MAKKALPPQDTLRQLLRYDPNTGKLFWRERGPEWFTTDRVRKTWNARYAGQEALSMVDPTNGYKKGSVFHSTCYAHRVAWTLVHGSCGGEIDHINGDRTDNRLDNLRLVDRVGNSRNHARNMNNSSGVTGVYWDRRRAKWTAAIKIDYKTVYLGAFDNLDDAAQARKHAEIKYGFHRNHGRHQ